MGSGVGALVGVGSGVGALVGVAEAVGEPVGAWVGEAGALVIPGAGDAEVEADGLGEAEALPTPA